MTFVEFAERWLPNYVDDPHFLKASSARHYMLDVLADGGLVSFDSYVPPSGEDGEA